MGCGLVAVGRGARVAAGRSALARAFALAAALALSLWPCESPPGAWLPPWLELPPWLPFPGSGLAGVGFGVLLPPPPALLSALLPGVAGWPPCCVPALSPLPLSFWGVPCWGSLPVLPVGWPLPLTGSAGVGVTGVVGLSALGLSAGDLSALGWVGCTGVTEGFCGFTAGAGLGAAAGLGATAGWGAAAGLLGSTVCGFCAACAFVAEAEACVAEDVVPVASGVSSACAVAPLKKIA